MPESYRIEQERTLRQEIVDLRKERGEDAAGFRRETADLRKEYNTQLAQFREEVIAFRKALEHLTMMVGIMETEVKNTRVITSRQEEQLEQVRGMLRGDEQWRGGLFGRLAEVEYRVKSLEVRREEIIKDFNERLDHLEQNREKISARIWQVVIGAATGSLAAFALGQLMGR